MIFELLQQKPCRIIYKFRQKPNFGPEACEIQPKVMIWSSPDLSRRTHKGPIWLLLDRSWQVRFPTLGPISHVSGSEFLFFTKFINDSAWFLLEKLKKHVILTKNLNISFDQKSIKKIRKYFKIQKLHENPGFPRDPCGALC